tara:strand:+ start:928 stop:2202 length:1275 start_codon:yes stop_codon:yes gene_type:complete
MITRDPIAVTPEGATWSRQLVGNRTLGFRASHLRKSRTGNHGRIEIYEGPVLLAYDVFNIDRDADRTRISNKAHKALGSDPRPMFDGDMDLPYASEDMRHDLDLFCREVYGAWVSKQGAELIAGDPDSSVEFLAKPHILESGGTILFGPQGNGKSYTAMILAVAIDSGTNGLWETRKCNVMYVNLERSAGSMRRRLARVNTALGLDSRRQLYMMNRRGRGLADLADALSRDVEEHAIDFLIVDSISRTGIGDLNENQSTNEAIDLLNGLGCAWLGIGHTPRETEDRVFGSTMWDAGADVMLRLTGAKQGGRHGIQLTITKENDLGPQPDLTLAYTFDERGLATVEKANVEDFPELVNKRKKSLPDEMEEFLLNEGASTGTQIADALKKQRTNVVRVLKADERFAIVNRKGNEVYYGVQVREVYQ